MAHLSLYRKYRSQSFEELVGQDHVVRALQNALTMGKVSHAYLFTGPRGTGKTSTARLLAKCLCAEGGSSATPDPESEMSKMIASGACPDVVEMDAASESGVDDIRQAIVEAVEYRPMMAPYKVYIIDEVHDLSPKAFDALLKTIEEPPDHVVFILATTEYSKVPPTVRSRCQKFEFHRASISNLVKRLEFVSKSEKIEIESAALGAIARMADGGYRDALTLLEQAILTSEGVVTLAHVQDQLGLASDEVVDKMIFAIVHQVPKDIIEGLEDAARAGRDPRSVLESMMYRLSDLTKAAYGIEIGETTDANRQAVLHETSTRIGTSNLLRLRSLVAEAFKAIRDVSLPRIWLESVAIGWAVRWAENPAKVVSEPVASAPKVAVPTAQKPPVAHTSAPKETTKPQVVKEEPSITKAVVDKAIVGDGEKSWDGFVSVIEAEAHKRKLSGSRLLDTAGSNYSVELINSFFVQWYADDLRRSRYIGKVASEYFGTNIQVTFSSNRTGDVTNSTETVELPVDGELLYKKVSNEFK